MRAYLGPLPPGAEDLEAGMRARDTIPVGIVEAQADHMLNPVYHSAQVLKSCGACVRIDSIPGASHLDLLAPWPEPIEPHLAFGAEHRNDHHLDGLPM